MVSQKFYIPFLKTKIYKLQALFIEIQLRTQHVQINHNLINIIKS